MTLLSDSNLATYKKYIEDLGKQTDNWKKYLADADTIINKNTGSTFRTEYAIGRKATTNIKEVIDILQSLQQDLMKLYDSALDYYKKSYNATNK